MVLLLIVVILLAVVAVVGALAYTARAVRVARDTPIDLTSVVGQLRDENGRLVDGVLAAAGARLDDRLTANNRELDLRAAAFDEGLEARNSEVAQQLLTLREQLQRMADEVQRLQRDRATQHTEFVTRLEQTVESQRQLATTTMSLREALASPKARGSWGERTADDVLRQAGFVEGVSYRRQTQTAAGTKPDFTFLLPEGRELNMDVKFPADNYLRYLEADDDVSRERHRKLFLTDVRNRVRELTDRSYIDPECTLDQLLLFIPNESIYSFIHEQDSSIAEEALSRKVVLCSPFTLFGVLSVIRQATELFRLERQGDEIHRCLLDFSKQWEQFSRSIDDVDKRLESLNKAFSALNSTRRNQLQKQVDRIGQLDPPAVSNPVEVGGNAPIENLALVVTDDDLRSRHAG
jgi:DNA recombination protein RmuC